MNIKKLKTAIDHNAYQLSEELVTSFNADIEWQLKSVERILKEKKKVSQLFHEMNSVDSDMEEEMTKYINYLNEQLAHVLNINYRHFKNKPPEL